MSEAGDHSHGRTARLDEGQVRELVGATLLVVLGVAALGLAATGRLSLYVHPRYVALTVLMAGVGLVVATAGLVLRDRTGPESSPLHEHDHARLRSVVLPARALLVVAVAFAVLVLPPSTLSASLRADRGLASSDRLLDEGSAERLVGADTTSFSVRDWAVLLQQGGADAVVGQPVDVTGYVLDRGEDDSFYVARLVISCCAVDAQPIGVAVRRPGWRSSIRPDTWVRVRGTFADDSTAAADTHPAIIDPTSVTVVPEPRNPYVF